MKKQIQFTANLEGSLCRMRRGCAAWMICSCRAWIWQKLKGGSYLETFCGEELVDSGGISMELD